MKTNSSQVWRFLKVFIPFILATVVFDRIIGYSLEYSYNHQKNGLLYRTNFAIDSTTSSYLVVGSSRANHHYDPAVFETALHDSFYNCGRDAQGSTYSAAIVSSILKRYTPKVIIIDVRPNEFTTTKDKELTSLLPYYKNSSIRPYLNYDDFQGLKLFSKIYPYNSLLTTIVVGMTDFNKKRSDDYRGYLPLKRSLKAKMKMKVSSEEPKNLSSDKLEVFKNLIKELEKRKIRTLIVISPSYYQNVNGPTVEICENLTSNLKHISFMNFNNNAEYNDPALFADEFHLNDKGAQKFSHEMANAILHNY